MLGVHVTVVLLLLIGLTYITKVLEESLDFNKGNSPVLADSISRANKARA